MTSKKRERKARRRRRRQQQQQQQEQERRRQLLELVLDDCCNSRSNANSINTQSKNKNKNKNKKEDTKTTTIVGVSNRDDDSNNNRTTTASHYCNRATIKSRQQSPPYSDLVSSLQDVSALVASSIDRCTSSFRSSLSYQHATCLVGVLLISWILKHIQQYSSSISSYSDNTTEDGNPTRAVANTIADGGDDSCSSRNHPTTITNRTIQGILVIILLSIGTIVAVFRLLLRINTTTDGTVYRSSLTKDASLSSLLLSEKTNTNNDDGDNNDDDELLTIRPLRLRSAAIVHPMLIDQNGTDAHCNSGSLASEGGGEGVLATTLVRKKLAEWLPYGLRYTSDLQLVYSTNIHGRSLGMFYDCLAEERQQQQYISSIPSSTSKSNHTILLMEVLLPATPPSSSTTMVTTTTGKKKRLTVGMYASQRWHRTNKVYGDGRCFLFRIAEEETEDNTRIPGRQQRDDNNNNNNNDNYNNKDLDSASSCCSNNVINSITTAEHWQWKPPPSPLLITTNSRDYNDCNNGRTKNEESAAEALRVAARTTAIWETFQRSDNETIRMGCTQDGSGAGLQLNSDFTKGVSSRAIGFDNSPLVQQSDMNPSISSRNTVTRSSSSSSSKTSGDVRIAEKNGKNNNSNRNSNSNSNRQSDDTGSRIATIDDGVVFDVGAVEVYQLVREIDGVPIQ